MKFINYTLIYFSFFMVLGITAAYFYPSPLIGSFALILILVLLLVLTWFLARKQLYQNVFFGIIGFSCFLAIGHVNLQLRLPEFQSKHYSNFYSENKSVLIQFKTIDILKADRYHEKYIVEAQAINGQQVSGKILLYLKKDSLVESLHIDEVLLVSTKVKSIPSPLNPSQFNYKKYMRTLGVNHQIKISKEEIIDRFTGSATLRGHANYFRTFLIDKLEKTSLGINERAILQALILGQKRDISRELYGDYIAAGAVHILAVSGLHVGILYFLFSILFKVLKNLRYGIYVHSLFIVITLWSFAFITGLSPSVTRAVTMFSFFALSKILNRPTNSINTLFLSFFVLLLVNPLWLFHIGFQLSYLAVLSILIIYPKLNGYYRPKNSILKIVWDTFTVSTAAQIGIIPLSLYYFHQFPGLFFLTNLVVIPFLGIVLASGLLVIFLAAINSLPQEIVVGFNFIIRQLNSFISWVAGQDQFLFEDIPFSEIKLITFYLFFGSLILLWLHFSFKRLICTLLSIAALIGFMIIDRSQASTNELVVFHSNRTTLIGAKQGIGLQLFTNDSIENVKNSFPVEGYRIDRNIEDFSEEKIPKLFKFGAKTILVLDSLGVYPKLSEKPIVLLTSSPKVHLGRLIDSLNPELIIADGSNYNSYVRRWRESCKQKKLPFHHTGTKGALIIE